ncbi:MAG: chromate transporter [Lacunisphaera sp.]
MEKRGWLDEAHYADLVALGQFLPGPASSQVGFGVGYGQRGLAGGLAAWLGFTLMIAFGYGVGAHGDLSGAGWLRGLKAAAVAVVAQAVWQMWRNLCSDLPRSLLAGASAAVLLFFPQAGSQVAVIAAGALIGWIFFRGGPPPVGGPRTQDPAPSTGPASGWLLLLLFLLLLVALPALVRITHSPLLRVADKFYRSGALVLRRRACRCCRCSNARSWRRAG